MPSFLFLPTDLNSVKMAEKCCIEKFSRHRLTCTSTTECIDPVGELNPMAANASNKATVMRLSLKSSTVYSVKMTSV